MSVVRYKYRPAAIQPELSESKENVSFSASKKIKESPVDPYSAVEKITNEDPVYLPSHTQIQRVEVYISSNEEAYRKKHHPTIEERVMQQREWARIQLREAKVASEREAMQLRNENQLQSVLHRETLSEAAKKGDPTAIAALKEFDDSFQDQEVVDDMIPAEPSGPGGEPLALEEEEEEDITATQTANDLDYAEQLMKVKEQKILAQRNSAPFHREWTTYQRRKISFKVQFGMMGKRDRDITEVLPWLLIGRKEVSNKLQTLLKLEITHILNVSNDLPNCFPALFIYKRIPIKDNFDANIAEHFSTIVNFIKRAQQLKGRVLVHCTVGASRAPTAVLAYLIVVLGLPLVDAYNYLHVMRPIIMPNQHFLYEMAMLECSLDEGCSVYYHKEWRFYEFNVFRGKQVPERRPMGLLRATMRLYKKIENEEDLLS